VRQLVRLEIPGIDGVVCVFVNGVRYRLRLVRSELVLMWFDDGTPHQLPVALETTEPHFGGWRWWARCPHCARRIAILYWYRTGFACRVCLGLAYTSTRQDVLSRVCRRTDKVRVRYGARPGLLQPWIGKPHRMRWATFERLLAREYEDLAVVSSCRHRRCDDFGRSHGS
jgi:hypothetical protein